MPKEETIELRHVRGVIGEKEDLPSLNPRVSLTSRVRALVTKFFGVPQMIHLYGALGLNKTLSSNCWALFSDGTYLYSSSGGAPAVVSKIDLTTYTIVSTLTLNTDRNWAKAMCSDGTYLYVGTGYFDDALPGVITKINLQSFTIEDELVLNPGEIGERDIRHIISDGSYLYVGTVANPMNLDSARIIKVDLNTFTIDNTLVLGVSDIAVVSLYTDGNYLYASTDFEGTLKINLKDLTIVDSIPTSYSSLFSDGIYLYGLLNNILYKIDLLTFSVVGSVPVPSGGQYGSCICSDGICLYVATYTDPATIIRVDQSTLKVLSTISLAVGESFANSIFSDGTYLYVGCIQKIVRRYIIPVSDSHQRKIDITKDSVQSAISATTSAGNVGGTTLIDTARTEGNDYWNNLSVLLLGGVCKGQVRRISDFDAATDTITVSPAFTAQIATSVKYEIIPTGSGTSTLVQADILSDATPFAGADISIIKADTQVIEDSTLKASPTAGSLSRFIASGGTALGTQLPDSKSLYDCLSGGVTTVNRIVGKTQILEVSVTIAANAAATTIATVTTQPCLIKSIVVHADAAQTADLTSLNVKGGASNVITFISDATATQANLDAADKQVAWQGVVRLAATKTITIDPTGTGATALDLTITIEYEACVSEGYLI